MAASPEIAELARRLNEQALATVAADGAHVAMFFLVRDDGTAEPRLFTQETGRPVGRARGDEIARVARPDEVRAVAFISEAWVARETDAPAGGSAGDASRREDALIVAAIGRSGAQTVLQTRLHRRDDGRVDVARTEDASETELGVFDPVRAAWGLNRHLAFGVRGAVPIDWLVDMDEGLIQLQPPDGSGAAHISTFDRPEMPPTPGEASQLLESFPIWSGAVEKEGPRERSDAGAFIATGSCTQPPEGRLWVIGVKVTPTRAVVFTYNDDGNATPYREQAREIFESLELPPSQR